MLEPAGPTFGASVAVSPGADPLARRPALLADDVDDRTGEIRSLFRAPHPVDAAVRFQLRTRRRSGLAVENAGTSLHLIRKVLSTTAGDIKAEIDRALSPLVSRKLVKATVTAATDGDLGSSQVVWENLRAPRGQERVNT